MEKNDLEQLQMGNAVRSGFYPGTFGGNFPTNFENSLPEDL